MRTVRYYMAAIWDGILRFLRRQQLARARAFQYAAFPVLYRCSGTSVQRLYSAVLAAAAPAFLPVAAVACCCGVCCSRLPGLAMLRCIFLLRLCQRQRTRLLALPVYHSPCCSPPLPVRFMAMPYNQRALRAYFIAYPTILTGYAFLLSRGCIAAAANAIYPLPAALP